MDHPLSPEEAALWERVLMTVRPLRVAPKPVAKVPPARTPLANAPKPARAAGSGAAAGGVAAAPRMAAKDAPAPADRSMFAKLLETGIGGMDATKRAGSRNRAAPVPASSVAASRGPANTLDGSWDKKLARGLVSPDCAIDLHGHNLSTAYATLDGALEQSIRMGDRVVLLVTGKPPRPSGERPLAPNPYRGQIRGAIGDWLAGSRHAAAIAAVRNAHPRHGGAGALYIILRRNDPNRNS